MSTTADRDSRGAFHVTPGRADLRRRSDARQAGAKGADEPEATELRTLLTRLGDGAEEAERRERARGRALRAVAAGAALVLVSAGAGVGLTLLLGGPIARNLSDAAWFRPAEPPTHAEPGPLPATDAALASRTDKLTVPVAGRAEPQAPEAPKPVAFPAVQATAPADSPLSGADAAKTAGAGAVTGAVPARASNDGKPESKRSVPPVAAAAAPAALSEPEIAAQLARAEGMLKNGDLAAARSFFRRVADAGDARGALGMARSYDPEVLRTLGRHGLRPDRAAAQDWYARARSLKNGPNSE